MYELIKSLRDALDVILRNPAHALHLANTDPKALRQLCDAHGDASFELAKGAEALKHVSPQFEMIFEVEDWKRTFEAYVQKGKMPGHFGTAILESNLSEAVAHADSGNARRLYSIGQLLHNLPYVCFGSKERVTWWVRTLHSRVSAQEAARSTTVEMAERLGVTGNSPEGTLALKIEELREDIAGWTF